MKKVFIYLFAIMIISTCFVPMTCFAAATQSVEISKMENNLYGFDYINDELKNRVSRLEKTVYGKESSGDLASRIRRLANDICADQIGQEITPCEDTFKEAELAEDSTVSYPIVDEIEKKLFGTTYKNRDFHTRIVTIERKLFGKIYDVEDYSTRMDRIKTAAMPEALLTDSDRFRYDRNAISSSDLSGITSSRYGTMPYGQQNLTRPYLNYGEDGGSVPLYQTPQEDELAQLEYDTFGTEFSGDDTRTRLRRLNSVNKAKKSSRKYDSQKFQQHMSTAMEIGAMILMILAMVL